MAERSLGRPLRPARPPRRIVPEVLLAGGSIVLVLVVLSGAEWLCRRLAPDYLIRTRGLQVFSEAYGWAGRPGAVAPMGGGRVTLNSRGYRGRELSAPKARGRTRVAVLGDSIAFGYGVSDEQTFPHLLDVRDNGLEVLNLGVEGYGPGQELLVLRREALGSDPDVVVLAVCLRNDFVDAVLPVALYDGITPRPRFLLTEGGLVLDDSAVKWARGPRVRRWLADESHLFNRVAALVARKSDEQDPGWRFRKREALRDQDYACDLTLALVMEMEKTCRQRGVGFLVATFPNGLGYGMRPEISRRFHESLQAEGVAVVDMGVRFRALGLAPAMLAIDRTGHLGPRGHALASEILEVEINARFRRDAEETG